MIMAYSDVKDYGPILRTITISFLVPTSVIFFWRLVLKLTRTKKLIAFGLDDVMLVLAMVRRPDFVHEIFTEVGFLDTGLAECCFCTTL